MRLIILTLYALFLTINGLSQVFIGDSYLGDSFVNKESEIMFQYPHESESKSHFNHKTPLVGDTLFLEFNKPDPLVAFIGDSITYTSYEITWTSYLTGYIILAPGIYDIVCKMAYGPINNLIVKIIIKENIEVVGTQTLIFNTIEGVNEVVLNGRDENGVKFQQLPFEEKNIAAVFVDFLQGHFLFFTSMGYTNKFYFSDCSSDIQILFSNVYRDTEQENKINVIEYPLFTGINQDTSLSNDPAAYINTNLKVDMPDIAAHTMSLGAGWMMKFICGTGYPMFVGFGSSMPQDPFDSWLGKIYTDIPGDSLFGMGAWLYSNVDAGGPSERFFISPMLCENNDSIGVFNTLMPTPDVYFGGQSDTLIFSNTPVTYLIEWLNNVDGASNIWGFVSRLEFLNEWTYPLKIESEYYKVKDDLGTIILSGFGSPPFPLNIDPGKYVVEIDFYYSRLGDNVGTSKLISEFDLLNDDPDPPGISHFQIRNSENIPSYRLSNGEEAYLYFCAANIIHNTFPNFPVHFFNYKPVNDDSTKVFIREYGLTEWEEITLEKYYEDTLRGSYYKSNLSNYTISDSSAMDLMIQIQDSGGNKTTNILNPAFLIGNYVITSVDNRFSKHEERGLVVFPNPSLTTLTISYNTEEYEKPKEIIILNTFGILVKKFRIPDRQNQHTIDISSFSSGLYFAVLRDEKKIIAKGKFIVSR